MNKEMELPENFKSWNTIYPQYINSKLTIAQGRRIGKEKAVENPTVQEMGEILHFFGIPAVIEIDKCYSRSWWDKGRIKLMLKDEDDRLINDEIQCKRRLLLKMAELIPKLKSRVSGGQLGGQSQGKKNKKKNKKKN